MFHLGRPIANKILQSLPPDAFEQLAPDLVSCDLPARMKLAEPGRECPWVYFPDSGVASIVGRVGAQWQEVGLFGQDGVGCIAMVLGGRRPPYMIVMQVSGTGTRAPSAAIASLFRSNEGARDVFLRYIQATMIQIAQSSIANCQYNTIQRMARWLLMIHDRVDSDSICLTHDYIAALLGVGRTGVTLALHALESSGMIRTARKRVTIIDRKRLENMTETVYGFAEAEYRTLLGPLALPHSTLSAAAS